MESHPEGKPVATTNTVVAALQFKYNNICWPIKPLNSLKRRRKNKSFYPL